MIIITPMKRAGIKIEPGRIAHLIALFAILFQTLIALPLSSRMMLDSEASGEAAVICTPLGPKTLDLSHQLPGHAARHSHCVICTTAAMGALASIGFMLIVALRSFRLTRFTARSFALCARPTSGFSSRAPPLFA